MEYSIQTRRAQARETKHVGALLVPNPVMSYRSQSLVKSYRSAVR
jgi:hypothetical protein